MCGVASVCCFYIYVTLRSLLNLTLFVCMSVSDCVWICVSRIVLSLFLMFDFVIVFVYFSIFFFVCILLTVCDFFGGIEDCCRWLHVYKSASFCVYVCALLYLFLLSCCVCICVSVGSCLCVFMCVSICSLFCVCVYFWV